MRSSPFRRTLPVLAVLVASIGAPGTPGEPPRPCEEAAAFSLLDFWLGEWEVHAGERRVGTNRIEKILSGCAIVERWTATAGGEGMSLFYHDPAAGEWRQVWVTEDTTRPGGLKEKRLVERLAGGGVRFEGEVTDPERGTYVDRTTLEPLSDGRVRQRIEISTDGGASWRTVFDAVYLPRGTDAAPEPRARERDGEDVTGDRDPGVGRLSVNLRRGAVSRGTADR